MRAAMGPRAGDGGVGWLGREALAHVDALHSFGRYLAGSTSDAEDLVQETYARALQGAAGFTPGTNLKAWLFRILRNVYLDLYRRRRNDPTVGGLDTVRPDVEAAEETAWLLNDVELDRLRSLVAADLEHAMLSLSAAAREVILFDLEGLTEVEVAEIIGCPVGTVKSRLSRARGALRQLLADYAK